MQIQIKLRWPTHLVTKPFKWTLNDSARSDTQAQFPCSCKVLQGNRSNNAAMWSAKKLLCWLKSYFLKTAETLDSLNWWQRFPIKTRGNGEHLERHALMLHNEGGTSFFVGVNVAVDRSLITTLNIWQTRVYRATRQAESPFLNVTGARFIICN